MKLVYELKIIIIEINLIIIIINLFKYVYLKKEK